MDDQLTFREHIEAMPGLEPYAIDQYEVLYGHAVRLGAQIVARETRKRFLALQGTPFVRGANKEITDALERDPTGRLASIKSLKAWALMPDGLGIRWVTWFVPLLTSYLASQHKAPPLVPMMVEGEFAGAVP